MNVVTFRGKLITRGGGTGAKRVMLENPERMDFIKSFTSWTRIEPGTLTVDGAEPRPLPALKSIIPLATERPDLLPHLNEADRAIATMRGVTSYYGALVWANGIFHAAILGQQPAPAVEERLEIISNERLRDKLRVIDGDTVNLNVYNPNEWQRLKAQ